MGVGLFRSKTVPAWLAVLFPICLIPATLAAPQDIMGGLLALPLVAVSILLSRALLARVDDEGASADVHVAAPRAVTV
jgi:hypothetical protein